MIHEIKLLQIHKRRRDILEQQKAKTGAHYNATILMEIEEIDRQVAETENDLKRRLHALHLKAATYDLAADPHITIEIEDIEAYFKENGTDVKTTSDFI